MHRRELFAYEKRLEGRSPSLQKNWATPLTGGGSEFITVVIQRHTGVVGATLDNVRAAKKSHRDLLRPILMRPTTCTAGTRRPR